MKLKRKKELGNELLNFHRQFQRKFKIHSQIKNTRDNFDIFCIIH